MIHGLEASVINRILERRSLDGAYKSLIDFVERTNIGLEQLCTLIRINALRQTGQKKKELLWKAHQMAQKRKGVGVIQARLFSPPVSEYTLPNLSTDLYEDAFDQMELLGFPLCNPYELLEKKGYPKTLVADLQKFKNKVVYITGYLISVKHTSTSNGKRMNFGTFIDMNGQFLDTTHFPNVAKEYPFMGRGVYLIKGKVAEEFEFYSIEVIAMKKLAYITDPRFKEDPVDRDKIFSET